jgi:hypothetical protein
MRSCRFELVRVLGRTALASACAILIIKGAPSHSPNKSRPYAFESTAVGSKALTKWPTCSTIYYSIDLNNAPKNATAVLARATSLARRITGLTFHRIGTVNPPSFASYDSSGSVAPVIFEWVDANQLFGQKNVNAVTVPIVNPSHTRFTSGIVLFNSDMNSAFQADPKFTNNLVLHELGHILGLGDVSDPAQVMNYYLEPNTTIGTYAPGDLAGLSKLYPDAHDCVQSSKLNSRSIDRIASEKEKQWG